MKNLIIALTVAFALTAVSPVMAGNKGKRATVVAKNFTNSTVAVAINPSQALLNATSEAEFIAAGGIVLNPGESKSVKVKAGTVQAGAALVTGGLPTRADFDEVQFSLGKGKTARMKIEAQGRGVNRKAKVVIK